MKRKSAITIMVVSIILMTTLLAACATQSALTTTEIVGQSVAKMDAVNSFHFELKQVGGGTPFASGLEMNEAFGDIVKPDKLRTEIYASIAGMLAKVEVITVGETTYMTNPLTGGWEPLPGQFSAVSIFDPNIGISAILKGITNPVKLEDGKVAGLDCYRIGGNIASEDLRSITLSSLEGVKIDMEVWIDKEEFLLRQIRLEGQITSDETPGIIRTLTLSKFDQEVNIELPK